MTKYIDAEKLIAYFKKTMESYKSQMVDPTKYPIDHIDLMAFLAREYQAIIANVESLQQEQPSLPTIKGWIARDDADRLGLYDQKPTRKTELGAFSGIVHSWVIGDTWIGRFSLDQTAKTLFPNLCWKNDPIEVELIIKPIQEQPEVNLEKEEFVGVAESPSKTFPRVNDFECGGSYRH